MKILLAVFCLAPALVFGQTAIYRSVGVATAIWNDGSGSRTFTISGSTITFSTSAPDTFGVGVCVEYDSTGLNLLINAVGFVHGRTSATVFTFKRATGGTPASVTNCSLWNAFHAYSTISNISSGAENANIGPAFDAGNRNIVTANETWKIVCYAIRDSIVPGTTGLLFSSSWVTGVSNKIEVFTPTLSSEVGKSQRHRGKYADYGYKLYHNSSSATDLMNFSNGTSHWDHGGVDGLAMKSIGTGSRTALNVGDLEDSDSEIYIRNCVIEGSDSVSTQANQQAVYTFGCAAGSNIRISNCIFYNFKNTATSNEAAIFTGSTFSGTITANNVTCYNNEQAFRRGAGTMNTDNCISNRAGNGWNGTIGGNFNISNLSSDAPGANSQNSTTVTFVNAAGKNYLLAVSSNGIDDGTDLSGSNPAVTTDILGTARPVGVAYDVGAHEFFEEAIVVGIKFWRRRLIR